MRIRKLKPGIEYGFTDMQTWLRIGRFLWPFRRLFSLSVICAILVSMFWALNLSIAFPVVKVLFENDSMHQYAAKQAETYQKAIDDENAYLKSLNPDQVSQRARGQARLSAATSSLLAVTWLQKHVLPWVPQDKFDTILLILGVLLAATLLKGVFIYLQELLVGSVVQLTVNSIRQECFRNALRLDYQTLTRIGPSSLMSQMTNDIEQLTYAIRIFGVNLVREPLKAGACTLIAFMVNWRLTLLAITVVPVLGLVFHRFGKSLRTASHRTMESMASIYNCIQETFSAFRVVIAFSGFRRHRRQFLNANRDYYKRSMKVVRISALIRPITEIMGVIAVFAALMPGASLPRQAASRAD